MFKLEAPEYKFFLIINKIKHNIIVMNFIWMIISNLHKNLDTV